MWVVIQGPEKTKSIRSQRDNLKADKQKDLFIEDGIRDSFLSVVFKIIVKQTVAGSVV